MQDLQLSGTAYLGTVSFPWSGDNKANLTFHLGDYGSPEKNAQAILEIVGAIQTAMPKPVPTNLKEAARARATEAPVQVTPVVFETATPAPVSDPVPALDAPTDAVQLDLTPAPDESAETVVVATRTRGRKPVSETRFKADGTPRKKPGRKPGSKNATAE